MGIGNSLSLAMHKVSFETSFDSKQPKLEPKLVSALSETKRLFRFFRFYTEIENFECSIEPKQTEDPPRQFKREYIWVFCRIFRVVSICFSLLRNRSVGFSYFDIVRNTETNRNFWFLVSRNKPKQTRNRSCFGLFRFEPKFIFVCFEDTLRILKFSKPVLCIFFPALHSSFVLYFSCPLICWTSVSVLWYTDRLQ